MPHSIKYWKLMVFFQNSSPNRMIGKGWEIFLAISYKLET